ncbi:OmpA family protein [Joostella atrarenae]|uniref:OmpA family protein n=1 Tax=Joostella atrarenae TaxID=679257 RepID=A0ABS9J040_9FLAO|nr:OmpA family protein [Joostella atrarenae]MCF8713796.1 OmpA family protein [Joostella atrarenae]
MKSTYLVGIILTIIVGSFFNWILCCEAVNVTSDKNQEIVSPKESTPLVNPMVIKDSTGDFNYTTNDNYNFNKSDFVILRPLGEGVDKGVDELKDYINQNNGKFININGFYSISEKNNSAFPNLGMARANAIKNHLIAQGVSSKKINTSGDLKPDLVIQDSDSIYIGPVSFVISSDSDFEDAEAIVADIIKNPIVLYFETGESTIKLYKDQKAKYMNIVKALDKVDNISVHIIGYTDNTGDTANNIALGKERAEFIKAYLVRNGIPAGSIETLSKGEEDPVANNSTIEGRAKNRRTVITIKKESSKI